MSDQTNEQPFARSKSGIAIPEEITQVRVSSVSIAAFERARWPCPSAKGTSTMMLCQETLQQPGETAGAGGGRGHGALAWAATRVKIVPTGRRHPRGLLESGGRVEHLLGGEPRPKRGEH